MQISKTKIDQLGSRLRKGNITDEDLRLLDEYRRSFTDAYESVVGSIRQQLSLESTGRPAKSTTSISEKLRRESIRLSQIQDIAGCRLIVSDIKEQEQVIASLVKIFPDCIVVDRRAKPSHGYRAVHVIVTVGDKPVEVQVRTALQQVWAEWSEKLSDTVDPAIKYGGGSEKIKNLLLDASTEFAQQEHKETRLVELEHSLDSLVSRTDLTEDQRADIMGLQQEATTVRAKLATARELKEKIFRDALED